MEELIFDNYLLKSIHAYLLKINFGSIQYIKNHIKYKMEYLKAIQNAISEYLDDKNVDNSNELTGLFE